MGYQRPRIGENFENLGHFSKKELYRSESGQKILDTHFFRKLVNFSS